MSSFRPLHRSVRLLFRKEVRQFLRNRQAVLTGLLLPAMVMVVAPGVQLLSASSARARSNIPAVVPGLNGINDVGSIFLYFTFPLFVVLAGLMTPSLAAVHTVISERERRSIELLVALPVSVTDIVTAKLGANLAVAAATLAPLFAIDAALILLVTTAGPLFVMAAFLVLLSALTASIGVSLLLALVARDFRTANNLNGAFVLPTIIVTGLCVALVPGLWRFLVLAVLLLAMGGAALWIALRWLTFERYLS
jgi:ABC-2 type transport system permease protein